MKPLTEEELAHVRCAANALFPTRLALFCTRHVVLTNYGGLVSLVWSDADRPTMWLVSAL